VIQRVSRASVTIDGELVAGIGAGLCVFVGVGRDDTAETAVALADKVRHLRILADEAGRMNRSVSEVGGEVLVVSQFTLHGDASRGRRPSWVGAAPAERAEPLVDAVTGRLRAAGLEVATGRFGADMAVELVNDGPVTLLVET
jgi:D-tyrosyl-tRNA(Tyr) deacylase